MKTKIKFQTLAWVLLFVSNSMCQWTLFYPIGSRSMAMENTGYILADDESALFYNPAGLGFSNYRWNGGTITDCYEQIDVDYIRSNYGITYQNDQLPKLGFAGYFNYFSDEIEIYSANSTGAIDSLGL